MELEKVPRPRESSSDSLASFLRGRSRSRARGFAFAVLTSVVGILVTAALRPLLEVAVLPPLIGTALLAAWCGGTWPGLLSVVLSTIGACYLLFEPVGQFTFNDPRDVAEVVIFATVSIVVVLVTASLREARDRVEARSRDLQTALQEMEEFTYAMAHNLRAPLRSMAGFGQIVQEEQGARLDDAGRADMDRIVQGSKNLDVLLQGLLSYAAITRVQLELKPVDPGAVIREILQEHAGTIERTKARVELSDPLPAVTAQQDLLRQVLTQLILNAVTFVAPGKGPVVRISVQSTPGWERIIVEDNGIGIPDRYQSKVFGLFERLNPETYPGTGIGLAIARRTVERMGGRIGLESEDGKGSRFWVELPSA